MNYNFIKTRQEDYCFYLSLARPEKRNAFNPEMINEIAHAVAEANGNAAVKVVVIQAEGSVFCAGMDLKAFQEAGTASAASHKQVASLSLGEVMEQLHKPSIAWVEGDVIAGAFLLIANCTYVFCRQDVRFRLPELAIGIFPFQVMASLLKVMSEKQMLQLCLNTDYFDVAEAIKYRLVDGYAEEMDLSSFVARFESFDGQALKAGIAAAKQLNGLAMGDRYPYLVKELDQLREKVKFADTLKKVDKA